MISALTTMLVRGLDIPASNARRLWPHESDVAFSSENAAAEGNKDAERRAPDIEDPEGDIICRMSITDQKSGKSHN